MCSSDRLIDVTATVAGVDFLDAQSLLPMLILALGLAMVAGNGAAFIAHRRGKKPKGEAGAYRPMRVIFFVVVGSMMAIWAGVSLLT